jgi:hypothetical protein
VPLVPVTLTRYVPAETAAPTLTFSWYVPEVTLFVAGVALRPEGEAAEVVTVPLKPFIGPI